MIEDVAEMLAALSQAEARKLAAVEITHAPTIGAMYEGLTREVLGCALPDGLDLQVVDGFVADGAGGRSGQIDGMLVRGTGARIPYTDQYVWHVKDVLAVFEVKKTLTAANLPDAYDQMAGVMACFHTWYRDALFDVGDFAPSYRTYAEITGQLAPPPADWGTMDPYLGNILYALRGDQIAPLRIILGYGGYKTEGGLRRAYLDYLETKLRAPGYGPLDQPSLIIGEGATLLKLSGHPYWASLAEDGYWPIVASTRLNPARVMLELIWTKLSFTRDVAELFGDDLDTEVLSMLIRGRIAEDPEAAGRWGWEYQTYDLAKSTLDKVAPLEAWEPQALDAFAFQLLVQCDVDGSLDLDDPDIQAAITEAGTTEDVVLGTLLQTRLVAMEGRRLRVIAQSLMLVALDDRWLAADNNTGRFERWLLKNTIE